MNSLLRVRFGFPAAGHRHEGPCANIKKVIFSLVQLAQSIFRILNSTRLSLRIELARLRRIAARSVCPPRGENDGIVRLREREACQCAARFDSALEHYPRRANISLTEQRAGARD